jgi:hypothetical protein
MIRYYDADAAPSFTDEAVFTVWTDHRNGHPAPYFANIDPPPAPPQNLRTIQVTPSFTSLRWARNLEPDLVGYNIYRGIVYPGSGEPNYRRINAAVVTDTFYTDTNCDVLGGLPQYTDLYHRYRITALDNQGNESDRSDYVDAYFAKIISSAVNTG